MCYYRECLQLLWVVVKLYVPASVEPDRMGDVVDDIDSMSDWDLLIILSGYCFSVRAFVFESLTIVFGSLM